MTSKILRVDSSPRVTSSVTRKITDQVIDKLLAQNPEAEVVTRDLATSHIPFVNETMLGGYFTPPEQHNDAMKEAIAASQEYVGELLAADTIVIGSPIYNFSVPGVLKSYIDLLVRAGITFKYTDQGPVGLTKNKKAYLIVASGGVPLDSPVDFTTPYLRHVLNFIGITDITVVDGSGTIPEDEKLIKAQAEVDGIFA